MGQLTHYLRELAMVVRSNPNNFAVLTAFWSDQMRRSALKIIWACCLKFKVNLLGFYGLE